MIKVIISGKVQGVFFRKNIYEKAIKLNLKGYVKNNNENVKAVFQGSEASIKQILDYCKKGPLLAKVTNIKIEKLKDKHFKNFEILY